MIKTIPALFYLAGALACAQEATPGDSAELQRQVNNPVAAMISVPVQTELYFGIGPKKDMVTAVQLKPVIPFELSPQWNLLTRVILPIAHVPNLFGGLDFMPGNRPSGSATGIGDIAVTAWLTPVNLPRAGSGRVLYGVGPALLMPAASSGTLGAGKWAAGPSVVVGYMGRKVITGGLVQNVWSYAGARNRGAVNQFMVQPFWSYRLGQGWSVVVSPSITANWRARSDRWTVPVGGGVGRLVRFGRLPVSLGAESFVYAIRSAAGGPRWTLRFNTKFILPR